MSPNNSNNGHNSSKNKKHYRDHKDHQKDYKDKKRPGLHALSYNRDARPIKKKAPPTPNINIERVFRKYDYLLELYMHARRKYFEQYNRQEGVQVEKFKTSYHSALETLRKFENSLPFDQKRLLDSRNGIMPEDRIYSINHNEKKEEVAYNGKYDDPHLLKKQAEANYRNDKEESKGSIDDYKRIKNL